MGHKNYTKYSESLEQSVNNEVQINETDVVNVTLVDEVPENTEVVERANIIENYEVITSTGETVEDMDGEHMIAPNANHVEGVVINCNKLNVRAEADKEAEVVGIFNKGVSVVVELENSTDDFYKVRTPGVQGYCMKNFIEIK